MTVLAGGMIAGYAVVALYFFRFWWYSRDRLFAIFSAAFLLLALQRGMLVGLEPLAGEVWPYAVRLGAFLLIIVAIVDKNRQAPAA